LLATLQPSKVPLLKTTDMNDKKNKQQHGKGKPAPKKEQYIFAAPISKRLPWM
jgi:hypothetical protein